MDHSQHQLKSSSSSLIDHSQMGHGDMDMCSMNMLFTWDYKNLCVIFKWWHIRSLSSFIFSLIAIALLGVGYEYLRSRFKRIGTRQVKLQENEEDESFEEQGLISMNTASSKNMLQSLIYASMVGYSYLLMLVFMTYNGWVMLSVAVGAGIGNYLFNTQLNDSLACH